MLERRHGVSFHSVFCISFLGYEFKVRLTAEFQTVLLYESLYWFRPAELVQRHTQTIARRWTALLRFRVQGRTGTLKYSACGNGILNKSCAACAARPAFNFTYAAFGSYRYLSGDKIPNMIQVSSNRDPQWQRTFSLISPLGVRVTRCVSPQSAQICPRLLTIEGVAWQGGSMTALMGVRTSDELHLLQKV
jgi:hypothetical protein